MLHLSILLHTFACVNIIYNLNGSIMKKLFVTICAAFAMLVMVSCGGNPAIKAGEAFIADPTEETYKAYTDAVKEIANDPAAVAEAAEWSQEKAKEFAAALQNR